MLHYNLKDDLISSYQISTEPLLSLSEVLSGTCSLLTVLLVSQYNGLEDQEMCPLEKNWNLMSDHQRISLHSLSQSQK